MSELGKASAAKRAQKRLNADSQIAENDTYDSQLNDASNGNEMEILDLPQGPPPLDLSWNKTAEKVIKKYSRSGNYSRRHLSRRKKQNIENAKGSRSIKGFLVSSNPSNHDISQVLVPEAESNFGEESTESREPLNRTVEDMTLVIKDNSEQQQSD